MARTEQIKSVLWRLARKLGMSPSNDNTINNLTDDQARSLLGYIHEGAKEAWESWDWQDICVVENRWYADPYVAGTQYTQNAIVYDSANGAYYQNVRYSGVDPGQPSVFPGAWQQLTLIGCVSLLSNPYLFDAPLLEPSPPPPPTVPPGSGLVTMPAFVPFTQMGKTDIDTVFAVYATDPRNQRWPIKVTYGVTQRGIELGATQLTNVWVEFRPPFPGIGSEVWDSTVSYNQYDYTYYNGDSYTALSDNTNVTPGTDGGVTWARFRLPQHMVTGVVSYAYALALEEDGQTDKAQVQYQKSEQDFIKEYDKQLNQQGLGSRFNVVII